MQNRNFYNDVLTDQVDIMLDLIIGKRKDEALKLVDIFMKMIKDNVTDEEKEQLEEAVALEDIHHIPARIKIIKM